MRHLRGVYGEGAVRVSWHPRQSGSYTMDHTALTYLLDPQGHLRLALRHEQSAEEVAKDLRTLMDDKRGGDASS